MTIKRKTSNTIRRVEIDLTGPNGNAFYLLGSARKYAKQLGKTEEETQAILDAMQSSDYDNLIEVFDQNFGDYVDLIRR